MKPSVTYSSSIGLLLSFDQLPVAGFDLSTQKTFGKGGTPWPDRRGGFIFSSRTRNPRYAGGIVRPDYMQLGKGRDSTRIPILYEDRSVMAIDKPAGWLLVPHSWDRTPRNLHAAISAALHARSFWVRSRNLRFLRHVHRLDGETTGILLLAKSLGGVNSYGDLFESRMMSKTYLAVVHGTPQMEKWVCQAKLARDPDQVGRMVVDPLQGKESETSFRVIQSKGGRSLIEAKPVTGRTHQIRIHLLESGLPIVGDDLYGPDAALRKPPLKHRKEFPMGLRAVSLRYVDPFSRRKIEIKAPAQAFLQAFNLGDPKPESSR